jgi:soluble lytic murein transglycosylase
LKNFKVCTRKTKPSQKQRMTSIDSTTWRAARRALEKAVALYLDDPNVALIDLGFRAGSSARELAVRIHVRNNLSDEARSEFAAEASSRIGFAVEVLVAAYDLHLRGEAPAQEQAIARIGIGGPSLHNRQAGTWGGKVRDRQSGEEMVLGSWHVLANSRLAGKRFPIGQSASASCDDAAELIRSAMHTGLDAAVIRLRDVDPLWKIATANGAVIPQLGMRVMKSGGCAGETSGIIAGVLGYGIQHGGGKQLIGPLIHIAPAEPGAKICGCGDSGAWWLEASTRRATALHFAGSDDPSFALAFSMPEVLQALEVEIMHAPAILPWQTHEARAHAAAPDTVTEIPATNPGLAPNPTTPRASRLARGGLLLALGMMIGGFCYHLPLAHRQQQEQIMQLQVRLQGLQMIAQTDSARQQQIQRIVAIIERFNRNMGDELKFRLAAEIHEMSLKYDRLDVELICATITHETGRTWNPEAISPAGALGLMQIMPTTGIYLARAEGLAWASADVILFDPIYNLRLGCRYLDELISNYGIEAGLAGYNGGDRQAKLWLQGGRANQLLHAETAYYVPAVLRIYEEYRRAAM